jgi:hypothetical protein|tara:strand:+ start:305 stop:835 length:531 start_codon:yes stop_codon:yes gene_type:complete
MNKSILLLFISILTLSCNTNQNSETAPNPIGHEISDEDGSKISLFGGPMTNVEVWENYISAHNNGDLEAIRKMNASENFKAIGPDGTVFDGTDAHIEFLTQWFTNNAPKWETNYLISNEYTDSEGALRQWVTSGHDITLNVEGNEVKAFQVHDALIVDGKVQMFYVYERAESPVTE